MYLLLLPAGGASGGGSAPARGPRRSLRAADERDNETDESVLDTSFTALAPIPVGKTPPKRRHCLFRMC